MENRFRFRIWQGWLSSRLPNSKNWRSGKNSVGRDSFVKPDLRNCLGRIFNPILYPLKVRFQSSFGRHFFASVATVHKWTCNTSTICGVRRFICGNQNRGSPYSDHYDEFLKLLVRSFLCWAEIVGCGTDGRKKVRRWMARDLAKDLIEAYLH